MTFHTHTWFEQSLIWNDLSFIYFPTIKSGFTDLIIPSDLHKYHTTFREIFKRVQQEKQGRNNRTEESYYFRLAEIWNDENANKYGRIAPAVTKDRYKKIWAEYQWRSRDMTQIWPLFGIDFSFRILSVTDTTIKKTKWKVQKMVDIWALEVITSFYWEVSNNSLLPLDYRDFKKHWNRRYGISLGKLPNYSDFRSLPYDIQIRINSLLRGNFAPAEHLEIGKSWVQEDLVREDDGTSEPARVVSVIPPSVSIVPTMPTWVMSGKIYSEKDYNTFLLRCDAIKAEYKPMIPRREEISNIWVLKVTEYTKRLDLLRFTSKIIQKAIQVFNGLLEEG